MQAFPIILAVALIQFASADISKAESAAQEPPAMQQHGETTQQLVAKSKELQGERLSIGRKLDAGLKMSQTEVDAVNNQFGESLKVWTVCLITQIDRSAKSTPIPEIVESAKNVCQQFRSEFVDWLRTTSRAMGQPLTSSDAAEAMLPWDNKEAAGMISRLARNREPK